MSDPAIRILRDRVAELDSPPVPASASTADPQLEHFVSVMSFYTNTEMAAESDGAAVLTPDDADDVTHRCQLLKDIAQREKGLAEGPLRRDRQRWIGTSATLDRSCFVEAAETADLSPSTKPFNLGLYTATATQRGDSMWQTYLNPYYGSDLHPLPWHSWQVEVRKEASVLEITSARSWAEFVVRYARVDGGIIYPDWNKAAQHYSGVHMTLRAIVATQGFQFFTEHGVTAAPYWDIESTLWLRWCFSSVVRQGVTY
ncbi:hypothetical protein ABZW18_03715 [Streptomyces sp. NPDC004647]|uniref:hypothetical protein n=1 Tax=Streptomyces sp. NPDC004647 TaxID=3154671 RepID=UPI0033B9894F